MGGSLIPGLYGGRSGSGSIWGIFEVFVGISKGRMLELYELSIFDGAPSPMLISMGSS